MADDKDIIKNQNRDKKNFDSVVNKLSEHSEASGGDIKQLSIQQWIRSYWYDKKQKKVDKEKLEKEKEYFDALTGSVTSHLEIIATHLVTSNEIVGQIKDILLGGSEDQEDFQEWQRKRANEQERLALLDGKGGPGSTVGGTGDDGGGKKGGWKKAAALGGAFAAASGALAPSLLAVGLGLGATLAGLGIAAGGVGYLIKVFGTPGLGETIKENTEQLLSIDIGETEKIAAADIAGAMAKLGAGLAVFGAGGIFASGSEYINAAAQKIGGRNVADAVKEDIETLLSIDVTETSGSTYGQITKAMSALGLGLVIFSFGKTFGTGSEVLNAMGQKIGGRNVADAIKEDVETLLSIGVPEGGFWGLGFAGHMAELTAGLAVLTVGEFFANLGELSTVFTTKIGGRNFAQAVKEDAETLLSIEVPKNGFLGVGFAGLMLELTAGLVLFGGGKFIANLGGIVSVLNTDLRKDQTLAEGIKEDVETLMSIDVPKNGFLGVGFAGLMLELTSGLIMFGVGKFATALPAVISGLDKKFLGGKRFAEGIKEDVESLLELGAIDQGKEKAQSFSSIMTSLVWGLGKLTATEFVSSLVNVGSGLFNFFAGTKSPMTAVTEFAAEADNLEKGSAAIDSLADALGKISDLNFKGTDLNMKAFAKDLVESVPAIEKAIMGGRIKAGAWDLGEGNILFKGLASGDIKFKQAVDNILMLRRALGANLDEASLNNMTMKDMRGIVLNNANTPVFNSNNNNSIFAVGKTTTKPNANNEFYFNNEALAASGQFN